MSLKDFMNKLQQQDDSDVVYSKPPEDTIHVIPPNQTAKTIEVTKPSIKIIPPDSPKPEPVLKFKLNIKPKEPQTETLSKPQLATGAQQTKPTQVLSRPPQSTSETPKQTPQAQQTVEKPAAQSAEKLTKEEADAQRVEMLFKASGTAINKRVAWYEYYERAKTSRKKNSVVDAIKEGRFAITMDNKVLILPHYDFKAKTTNDILKDKWIKN